MSDLGTIFSNYGTQVLGISGDAMFLLVAVLISIGVSITVIQYSKNKDLGIISFFFMYSIFAFFGIINWIFYVVPLILIAILFFVMHERGENR